MKELVSLIEAVVWPGTIILLVFIFRSEMRAFLAKISGLEVRSGSAEIKIILAEKIVRTIEEQAKSLPDEPLKKKIEQRVNIFDKLDSLTRTQENILLILNEGPSSRLEISRKLKQLYGSETRASQIQKLLDELVGLGVVSQDQEGLYELL